MMVFLMMLMVLLMILKYIADQDDDHFSLSPYLRYQVGAPMTGNGFRFNLDTEKSLFNGIFFHQLFCC